MNRARGAADPVRRRARRRGRLGELLCRWHLRLRGWRILAADWRCPSGEIDIVARRSGVLAMIEVKSRPDYATGVGALLPRQRRRIMRAAEAFLLTRPDLAALSLRFDVMVVMRRSLPAPSAERVASRELNRGSAARRPQPLAEKWKFRESRPRWENRSGEFATCPDNLAARLLRLGQNAAL